MAKVRLFTSFDFDHDEDLRNALVGQAALPDSPFEISDRSLKESLSGDWKQKVRDRMTRVDQVCVICGEHMDSAAGASAELSIAQELHKPYFLLWGRKDKTCLRPKAARPDDKIYEWTWPNLKILIGGTR